LWALRQEKPIKIWRGFDKLPETRAFSIQIGATLENICHACAKDSLTVTCEASFFIPSQRFTPMCITKKSARGRGAPKLVSHSLCPQLCIAVVASSRNFFATPPRVKCVMCPLNVRVSCHFGVIVALKTIVSE
jgi:hypothetical protein